MQESRMDSIKPNFNKNIYSKQALKCHKYLCLYFLIESPSEQIESDETVCGTLLSLEIIPIAWHKYEEFDCNPGFSIRLLPNAQ